MYEFFESNDVICRPEQCQYLEQDGLKAFTGIIFCIIIFLSLIILVSLDSLIFSEIPANVVVKGSLFLHLDFIH